MGTKDSHVFVQFGRLKLYGLTSNLVINFTVTRVPSCINILSRMRSVMRNHVREKNLVRGSTIFVYAQTREIFFIK